MRVCNLLEDEAEEVEDLYQHQRLVESSITEFKNIEYNVLKLLLELLPPTLLYIYYICNGLYVCIYMYVCIVYT